MSSQIAQPKPARTRRASRAPSRMNDENAAVSHAVGTANTRLISKASSSSLAAASKLVAAKSAVSVSTTQGGATAGSSKIGLAVTGNARKALGDVSNANARAPLASDRHSKESINLAVKPAAQVSRSRAASATSVHPSSDGVGFSKLTIGSGGPSRSTRPLSRASRSDLKAPGAPTLKSQEWPGAYSGANDGDDDERVETLRDPQGLGINAQDHDDWVTEQMRLREPAYIPSSSPQKPTVHKRGHEDNQDVDDSEVEDDGVEQKVRIVDPSVVVAASVDGDNWILNVDKVQEMESVRMLTDIKDGFDEPMDFWDTTMVAEYSEEIFAYMSQLEESCMPDPRYMEHQTEIEWPMRTTLIDWLLQVHMRYHMLPETLWIAINIVDRFLSNRVVSLVKFQLVGVTAMFIAAKYEEIMAPSVDEFVYMTEGGYTRDEILKGERIILQSLEFNISPYCTPYSWVRRISKADDYDIQTRTLSKFLMEVTLLDHRFLRAKPSQIAAIGMYLARQMLGGEWNESFMYYSNYTEQQLLVPTGFLLEAIAAPDFDQKFVYKKYANKKFLKASIFARNWAKQHSSTPRNIDV
ncbi:B-type cyclin [Microbotryomycetes sp. JL201]|nr:B-type cyclin [Microbotryomycetes sp. JL201]